ncbi:MAG: oligopeptide/dipeptide ABC transporter ATP-binding protein [Candidatus Limnocylindrales bacterium]
MITGIPDAPDRDGTMSPGTISGVAPLVRVRGLEKSYQADRRLVRAVAGVDLDVRVGEVHALVGESGSGKTTLARCILRLVEPTAGTVEIDGQDVLGLRGSELRALRRQMQLVFQDPQGSLDPRLSVLDLVAEPIRTHLRPTRSTIGPTVLGLVEEVGLARRHLDRRPHELSGGQCQRVAIARALALRPRLLILDEPTSALDVSVQAQILNLLLDLRAHHGLTYLLISHDLAVVRHLSDRISVMYLGRIAELAEADALFEDARHPYTRALLAAVPEAAGTTPAGLIRGDPPSPAAPPSGCSFHPRCWLRDQVPDPSRCASEAPQAVSGSVRAACHWPELVPAAARAAAVVDEVEGVEVSPLAGEAPAVGPAPLAAPAPGAVTAATWQDAACIRWSYGHIDQVLPVARIAAGPRPAPLPAAPRDLGGLEVSVRGRRRTVDEILATTETDGFLVLHHGRILEERYGPHLTPETPHLLQSVSKSLTSGLVGALVQAGRLDPDAPVTRYIEELRGGSFEGCTVQHLLDMRAGTRFSEAYEDEDADIRISEQVSGWRPRTRSGLPPDLYRYMPGLVNDGPHGGPFRYRSILTDLLGWVVERAGGDTFANLLSRLVWQPMGAEHDALVTVDAGGAPVADGGLCVTLRDLGRYGLLHLAGGEIDGRRVLPAAWTARVGVPRADLVAAFCGALAYDGVATPSSHYHDCWWVFDAERGIYGGIGIHGQALVIHRPAGVVVAKLSTHADPLEREKHELALAMAVAVGNALEREG